MNNSLKYEDYDGVKVIEEHQLLGLLTGSIYDKAPKENTIKIKNWIIENNAYYYRRKDSDRSIREAVILAALNNKSTVVVF